MARSGKQVRMKTELEEEFFKVFGIEPKWRYKVHQFCHFYLCDKKTILENAYLFKERKTCKVKGAKKVYPEITDRKLLEMICILATTIKQFKVPPKLNIEQLKYHILRNCINEQENIYTRVKSLFKEEE
jgi:hypothetical protein